MQDRALKSKLFMASRVSSPNQPPQGDPKILQPNILSFQAENPATFS